MRPTPRCSEAVDGDGYDSVMRELERSKKGRGV